MHLLLAALELVTVHMIDGRVVQINPAEITSMVWPREASPNTVMTDGVNCVISFTDGKFLSVAETCSEVQELMGRNSKGERP